MNASRLLALDARSPLGQCEPDVFRLGIVGMREYTAIRPWLRMK